MILSLSLQVGAIETIPLHTEDLGVDTPPATPREIVAISDETLVCLVNSDLCPSANANTVRSATDMSRGVSAPVFTRDDNFSRITEAYEENVNGSSEEVKELIGRGLESWIANTCVIRLSYALNQSQIPNLRIDRRYDPMLNIISDRVNEADGPYAYRVEEFTKYLVKRYGRPSVIKVSKNSVEDIRAPFRGRQGVILFVVNWANATGHFDLWDGDRGENGEAIHSEYFANATHVFLWE